MKIKLCNLLYVHIPTIIYSKQFKFAATFLQFITSVTSLVLFGCDCEVKTILQSISESAASI